MKRLEEIFDTTISDYNKRVSHVYAFKFTDVERMMFFGMIQRYAREVAQASLEKAAEVVSRNYNDSYECKQDILNPKNITLL